MWHYFLVLIASFAVDLVPFMGPPAWTVMVFFQMRYDLNIWAVIVTGVIGSAIGRYVMSKYIPYLSAKIIRQHTIEDIEFIGSKLNGNKWKVGLFIVLYTLMPLPSTPLFTAAGMARIKAIHVLPGFLIGKFTSDMIMVISGDYLAQSAINGTIFLTWQNVAGSITGILLILTFLFIDWRRLLQNKQFRLNFHIWK